MVKKFMYFDEMLTPKIIQIVFWAISALIIISGLVVIAGSFSSYNGGAQFFTGLLIIILGPIGIRIWCELMIVIFKIHESLQAIRERI